MFKDDIRQAVRRLAHRSLVATGAAERALLDTRKDMVLVYHGLFDGEVSDPLGVSAAHFDWHLAYLKSQFDIVALDALFAPAGERSRVAITFDDAYENFLQIGLPLLQRHAAPATVFVPTRFIDDDDTVLRNTLMGNTYPLMSWEQMAQARATGLVAFECHSHAHADFGRYPERLRDDLAQSIDAFQRRAGYTPRYFAYPYGARTPGTDATALAFGFQRIFSTAPERVGANPLVGRFYVARHNQELATFKLMVAQVRSASLRAWLPFHSRSSL